MAILEAGQYNTFWPLIHMQPEETVQAATELQAKVLLPVHWGKFSLSMHSWKDPIERVMAKAAQTGQKVVTPMIGERFRMDGPYPQRKWWTDIE
jgi:L-ascorbate metabolism protein UlaG (beta-lactamase superfamily)